MLPVYWSAEQWCRGVYWRRHVGWVGVEGCWVDQLISACYSLSGPQRLLSEDVGAVGGRLGSTQDGGKTSRLRHRCRYRVGLMGGENATSGDGDVGRNEVGGSSD